MIGPGSRSLNCDVFSWWMDQHASLARIVANYYLPSLVRIVACFLSTLTWVLVLRELYMHQVCTEANFDDACNH